MHRTALLAFAVFVFFSGNASALPLVMTAGHWKLLPDTPGQTTDAVSGLPLAIVVSGGDPIEGAILAMTIGDGATGPSFDGFPDLIGPGTIFNANNLGQNDGFFGDDVGSSFGFTFTTSGFLAAEGTLAFLSIDTTGLNSGSWTLHLSENVYTMQSSDLPPYLAGDNLILVPGSLTIVPEPSAILLGVFAVVVLAAFQNRCGRHRTLNPSRSSARRVRVEHLIEIKAPRGVV